MSRHFHTYPNLTINWHIYIYRYEYIYIIRYIYIHIFHCIFHYIPLNPIRSLSVPPSVVATAPAAQRCRCSMRNPSTPAQAAQCRSAAWRRVAVTGRPWGGSEHRDFNKHGIYYTKNGYCYIYIYVTFIYIYLFVFVFIDWLLLLYQKWILSTLECLENNKHGLLVLDKWESVGFNMI